MALAEKPARQLTDKLLALARKLAPGADAAVSIRASQTGNTRFARNQITSSGDVEEIDIAVDLGFGLRHASASTNQADDASLRELVVRAARLARLSPEDPERLPPLGAQKYVVPAGAHDPATGGMSADARATAVGAAITRAPQLALAGFYRHAGVSLALATSAGLSAYHRWSEASFTCTARTPDGSGSGWAGAGGNRAAALDPGALAAIAADKAVRAQKPRSLAPGKYTVILEPAAVVGIGVFMTGVLDQREADEGRSVFSKPGGGNRIGEAVFGANTNITLRSDPRDVALAGLPFDPEGVPLTPTTWIDRGKLAALPVTRFWGKKTGKPATGYPSAWILDGGTTPRAKLLEGVKRGVLVSRVFYTGMVDPQTVLVTGLTRDGVFLVENGEIVAPVNNFRWNQSVIAMLTNADAMSPAEVAPTDFGLFMRAPAIRTHDFNLASVSDAV